jgi:hypothetical protein
MNSGWPSQGVRLELGVELHADEPGVHRLGQLDHLGQLLALGDGRDHQAGFCSLSRYARWPRSGGGGARSPRGRRSGGPWCRASRRALRAQAHGAAQVDWHRASGRCRRASCHSSISAITGCGRFGLELGGVGTGQPGLVAGVLDGGHLHAQADAQVGDAVLAGVLGRAILPSMPRLPKPPGTRMASNFASWLTVSGVSVSESTYSMLTRRGCGCRRGAAPR